MEDGHLVATENFFDKLGNKTEEDTSFNQTVSSKHLESNGGLKIVGGDSNYVPDFHDTPLLFKNMSGKIDSLNSHGISNNESVPGTNSLSFTSSNNYKHRPGNDLLNMDIPSDLNDPNSGVGNSFQNKSCNSNLLDLSTNRKDKSFSQAGVVDGDRGYTSENMSQTHNHTNSLQNGVDTQASQTKLKGGSKSNVGHKLADFLRGLPNTELHLKQDSTKNDLNMNQTKNSSDVLKHPKPRSSHYSESDGIHQNSNDKKNRVRTTSHPGNSKISKSKNKPGGMSDDEYISNLHPAHHGRRSAPIFTKHVFSASEFWNSGQTAIERSHLQDIANARLQNTQRGKSPATSTFGIQRLLRPHSVDPESFLNAAKQDQVQKPGHFSHRKVRRRLITYGSTINDDRNVEHRGYLSENEAQELRLSENEKLLNKDGSEYNGSMVWNIDDSNSDLFDGVTFRNPSQDDLRARGIKGVFRIPHAVSPRVFQIKLSKGQNAEISGNKQHESILDNDSYDYKKSPVVEDSDDDTIDEDSNESAEDKLSDEKSSDELYDSKLDIKPDVRTEIYKRRWYLLFLFSIIAMLWNAIWSTWGPIAQSAKAVYGWGDGDIAMFTYLGNIPFLITMFPCAYLMDVSGMRVAMICCCIFMFAGTGFRCIPGDNVTSTWLIRTGQLLNGMAGTIPSSGPALLSSLWFPPNQRATATAVSTVAGYLGASISFILGPMLVPEPSDMSINGSDVDLLLEFGFQDDAGNSSGGNNTSPYSDQERGIKTILYGECALSGAMLLLVLLYFPSKPPLPPSISASIPREKYLNGLKLLLRNKQFWICAIAFSVPLGVYESWQVILDINLDSKGISQTTAGWLDFYATVGGCVSGLLVSRFADLFIRQIKLFLLIFYAFATVAVLWFTLVVLDIIPFDQVSIFAAIIIAGVFLDGGSPLFFELTIEVSYPVGEGVTSGFAHMLCAAAGTVFLIIVQIKNIGTDWMNWCFFGIVAMTLPLLMFINTSYARADVDDMEIDISDEEEASTNIGSSDVNEKTSLLKNSSV